jgi:arylsulfatase
MDNSEGRTAMKLIKQTFMALAVLLFFSGLAGAQATGKKPNILVIWGDDIGQFNVSADNMGMMG